ncbi:pentatricopeptide repeat-containing protein 2, mitochondrial-like [Coccinella septempunctata]|uniref:pentatricopeptide repeat-containing protein 2, mitochondrial-like n=1 Tax=Coccinella septempunctata TaxID=41139 RepID=UPI001D098F12|nr:pentatricopeptide repeat-containing protein 2, mitochondrial-like [Coccinella septempunctata]
MLKMSGNAGRLIKKFASIHLNRTLPRVTTKPLIVTHIEASRTLYCKASLGIDNFELQKVRTKHQLSNLEEKFKERMREYVSDEKNMIFTEDLKNMVYLTDNDQDVELVVAMIKRFNKQNQQLRFGSFKFGPIVMRMFHVLNKPQLAIECFQDTENFPGFFDQLVSFQTYLDLLYNNGMYKEVLEGFQQIEQKQLEGALFPRNSFVIALAACYKLNTKESLEYALQIWNKAKEYGYYPTRRAITFCSALALNQGKPEVALEMVSSANNQNYTTIRNIKALALTDMGRLVDAIVVLKSVLSIERGEHTFNKDVIDKIKTAVLACDSPEITVEFNKVHQLLQKQGNITEKTLDDQLSCEIQKPPQPPQGQFNKDGGNYRSGGFNQRQNLRPNFRKERPGLEDLV